MNTLEKIDRATNLTRLCLHKEGIFYKLYNQHAMLFTDNVKALKVKVKFIKVVNQEVYSCGFPATIIEEIKKQCVDLGGVLEETEKMITVVNINWQIENDYVEWGKEQKREEAVRKNRVSAHGDLAKEIIAFPVMHKTPMEAIAFISELQKKISQYQ